jgi:hypothetical protein
MDIPLIHIYVFVVNRDDGRNKGRNWRVGPLNIEGFSVKITFFVPKLVQFGAVKFYKIISSHGQPVVFEVLQCGPSRLSEISQSWRKVY